MEFYEDWKSPLRKKSFTLSHVRDKLFSIGMPTNETTTNLPEISIHILSENKGKEGDLEI